MGWGGAWRQEELKRFSSWETTKLGLSQRAVGPPVWWVRGSRCNVGFCRWGQHFPSLFLHTSGSAQGPDLEEFAVTFANFCPNKNYFKGFRQSLPRLLWGIHSKVRESTVRGLIQGATETSLSGSARLCFCNHCSRNSNEGGFPNFISPAL